ncbi:carboxypeptidase regulatory-like domain-containing protein [Pseudomonas sp. R5(2019)]|uniref:carboxypeptidase regulatory-like domain-containing protein n=1 Tax=Pseudomonas sp. R5(2019) TaxID=2697566 RepID=UPI0014123E6C|nr:carboxypeptidase regulatory-like domain-containing protein [Pseudomonas sp. R5(2019)]NBA98405.1 hypothetical protein [Pseudomonas sp. R5(2019)]
MKSLRLLTLSGVALIGLAGLPAAVVQAACEGAVDPSSVHLQQQQQNGITYISGGIGMDESCAIQQVKGYNLHMTFSTGSENKYVSGVNVAIQSAQGKEVLNLTNAGPIVLTQLPAGKYFVVAQRNGKEVRNAIDISDGGVRTLNIHWDDAS